MFSWRRRDAGGEICAKTGVTVKGQDKGVEGDPREGQVVAVQGSEVVVGFMHCNILVWHLREHSSRPPPADTRPTV